MSALPASHTLLEREQELDRLVHAMAAAADGRGAAVILEGPAGIGKTSLLAAALRLAGEARLGVLAARGGELERDYAYGVVRQLLERRILQAPDQDRERWLDGAAALAAPLLGGSAASPGDDPTAAALHGLYWLVANLSGDGPLLLAVDDMHWVDTASLRFLAYLARRIEELPVLLLAATRPLQESHAPELLEALEADRIEPAPLSVAAVGRLVGEDHAEAYHAATGGNPFFVAALQRHGDLDDLGTGSVARFVSRRLAGLGPDAASLARAVAVLGTDAEPRHAYEIAELDPHAGNLAEDALVTAGVLAPKRPLEFVHPIVRAAVAQQLSPPERARRHLAAARLLGDESPERIAPHLLAADARGDPWVVDTLRAAAHRSVERGAPEAAVRYLRRALDEPPAEKAPVLAELGRAEVRAALPDDAVEHLRAALQAGSSPELVHDLAIGLIAPGRYGEAVAMLEESAHDADPELGRRIDAELLCAARLDPETLPIAARVYARIPPRIPDTPGGRMLLAALAHERLLRGGGAAEVRELAARALDGGLIAEQTGDSGLVMDAGFAIVMAGDFDRADRGWADALADVRRRGSVIGFARTSCMRAMLRLRQGRLADAESDARNAVEAAWEPGYRIARMAHGPLVEALVAQGELDQADAALAAAGLDGELADTYMLTFVLHARGVLRLAQGRGADDLEELRRRLARWGGGNPAVFPCLAVGTDEEVRLARAWGAPGPLGRALRILGLARGDVGLLRESLGTLDGTPWRLEHAHTLVELGAALRRGGRRSEAREPLYAGMEIAHACGARPLVARAREELLATGARPRRVLRTGVDALTASERRVARMAAEGMTNREIAQALFVTTRTIEVHLTHAYQKLDIATRDELPAALR